jgi:hypothetical protein
MTETAPYHETRQQKAAREIAEAEQLIRDLQAQRELGAAFVADHSNPLRKRFVARLMIAAAWAGQACARGQIRLTRPRLADQTFSERMYARSQEELELSEESRHSAQDRLVGSPVAARRPALNAMLTFAVGWLILGAVIAADWAVFRAFGVDYFRWYVENGALINLAFSFVALAVVLDAYHDLVSSNPMRYLNALLAVSLHVTLAWGATMPRGDDEQTWWFPKLFDGVVSFVVYLVMLVATTGWLVAVAPVQHAAYAVLGAPARNALRNKQTASYDPSTDTTTFAAPADGPRTGFAIGYREKPVALTAGLVAVAFWLISLL